MPAYFKQSGLAVLALWLAACAATPTAGPTSVPSEAATLAPAAALTAEPVPTRPAPAGVVTFVIDSARTVARYSVDETFINDNNRLGTAVGRTSQVTGQIALNFDDPAATEFGEFTVDISTLQSDSRRRDDAIRREWLESASYPVATFVVRDVLGFPAAAQEGQTVQFKLLGDLTVRTETRAVTWEVTAKLEDDVLSGQATAFILLADFGVEPPSIAGILTVKDGVTLTLDFVMLPTQ